MVKPRYATAALAAGVPAKVVSERLGHANIAITMDTYSHVLPGTDERAASAVARLILGDEAAPIDGAVNNCEQPDQRPTRPERREPQNRW